MPSLQSNLRISTNRAMECAELLYKLSRGKGIFNHTIMPEDILPEGMTKGSLEHLIFITLTVALDYQRDSDTLWENSRATYNDPETQYLFSFSSVLTQTQDKIMQDMKKHHLSQRYTNDADAWIKLSNSFSQYWNGNPLDFIEDCHWNGKTILERLKLDKHQGSRDFPYLSGDKIGPLWVRMIRDNVGIEKINNLNKIPIPVDIHIARATFTLGVIHGTFNGPLSDSFPEIREAWRKGVMGLNSIDREMIALDVDEPVWMLSKYGCTDRDKVSGECEHFSECELKEYCIKGKIDITSNNIQLVT